MIAAVSPVIATNIFFSAQDFSAQNPPIFTEGLSFTITGSLKAEAHLNIFSTEKNSYRRGIQSVKARKLVLNN